MVHECTYKISRKELYSKKFETLMFFSLSTCIIYFFLSFATRQHSRFLSTDIQRRKKISFLEIVLRVTIPCYFLTVYKLCIISYEILNIQNFNEKIWFIPETSVLQSRLFTALFLFCLIAALGERCCVWDSTTYFQQITVLKPMKSDSSKHYSVVSGWNRFIFLFLWGMKQKDTLGCVSCGHVWANDFKKY